MAKLKDTSVTGNLTVSGSSTSTGDITTSSGILHLGDQKIEKHGDSFLLTNKVGTTTIESKSDGTHFTTSKDDFVFDKNIHIVNSSPGIFIDTTSDSVESKITFRNHGRDQGVTLRYNHLDSERSPFGLHIEKSFDNKNSLKSYLQVEGEIYADSTHQVYHTGHKPVVADISGAATSSHLGDITKLTTTHKTDLVGAIDEINDKTFYKLAGLGTSKVYYYKILEMSSVIGSSSNQAAFIITGLGGFGSSTSNLSYHVSCSTRNVQTGHEGEMTITATSLNGYSSGAVMFFSRYNGSKTELWVKTPTYPYETYIQKLDHYSGTIWSKANSTTTDPGDHKTEVSPSFSYNTLHKPTKSDIGLPLVNNWSASKEINSTSDTTYATASAVKIAYDHASKGITDAAAAKAVADSKMTQSTGDSRYVNVTGDSMSGALTIKSTLTLEDTDPMISFKTSTFANAFIKTYNSNTSGANMIIQSGTAMVIGSGEYPTHRADDGTKDSENEEMYIGSDGSIHFETGAQTYTSKKTSILDASGNLKTAGTLTDSSGLVYTSGRKPNKNDVGLGSVNNWGASSSVASTNGSQYATSAAVKLAYDHASTGITNAATAQKAADTAKQMATAAQTTANSKMTQTTADGRYPKVADLAAVSSVANSAQSTANTAKTAAAHAQSTADSKMTQAQGDVRYPKVADLAHVSTQADKGVHDAATAHALAVAAQTTANSKITQAQGDGRFLNLAGHTDNVDTIFDANSHLTAHTISNEHSTSIVGFPHEAYSYGVILTIRADGGSGGVQLYSSHHSSDTDSLWFRTGYGSDKRPWARVYSTNHKPSKADVGLSNVQNVSALPLTGGTMSGDISTNESRSWIDSEKNPFIRMTTSANSAGMLCTMFSSSRMFSIGGLGNSQMGFYTNLNTQSSNSQGATCSMDGSGNWSCSGNVTAYSDIRLKENIIDVEDITEKIDQLRLVEYDRIDIEKHEYGVIAQEIIDLIPSVVNESSDENKTLSVDYGKLGTIVSIAANKRVKELEEKVLKLEKLVEELLKNRR